MPTDKFIKNFKETLQKYSTTEELDMVQNILDDRYDEIEPKSKSKSKKITRKDEALYLEDEDDT